MTKNKDKVCSFWVWLGIEKTRGETLVEQLLLRIPLDGLARKVNQTTEKRFAERPPC